MLRDYYTIFKQLNSNYFRNRLKGVETYHQPRIESMIVHNSLGPCRVVETKDKHKSFVNHVDTGFSQGQHRGRSAPTPLKYKNIKE